MGHYIAVAPTERSWQKDSESMPGAGPTGGGRMYDCPSLKNNKNEKFYINGLNKQPWLTTWTTGSSWNQACHRTSDILNLPRESHEGN